jgi:ABC-2 type transport system permease protein
MTRPIIAIIKRNILKLIRDKMRLFATLFMTVMFLFIFSFVTKSVMVGMSNPLSYLISGIIIMTVFQTSLNNSMNILEDISSGFMKEILVAPIKRWQIAIGQVLSSAIIAVLQGMIIIVMGIFLGLRLTIFSVVLMIIIMIFTGITFSSIGLYLAAKSKNSTNFQLLITIISFPLMFLSGAYIPTMVIPQILMPVIFVNPLTHTTAIFRYAALNMESMTTNELLKAGVAFNAGGFIITPAISALIVAVIGSIFFVLCVRAFTKADFSQVKVFKRGHR